ncbi:Hypothetical protein ACGLYG10_1410 [Actinomyces glycerinitolerans]|uniref:Uncharacterized protein n=1 Tax=Actinomyces glycerinitolerans TaxID=1892869 RepID=A0A1M4RYY9_9ACTO|nr:Hypothetical protein ACGLYG10_1410 [Actinomyces glycerinitolerans]
MDSSDLEVWRLAVVIGSGAGACRLAARGRSGVTPGASHTPSSSITSFCTLVCGNYPHTRVQKLVTEGEGGLSPLTPGVQHLFMPVAGRGRGRGVARRADYRQPHADGEGEAHQCGDGDNNSEHP